MITSKYLLQNVEKYGNKPAISIKNQLKHNEFSRYKTPWLIKNTQALRTLKIKRSYQVGKTENLSPTRVH